MPDPEHLPPESEIRTLVRRLRRIALAMFMIGGIAIGAHWWRSHRSSKTSHATPPMVIEGDAVFRARLATALKMLETHAPAEYAYLHRWVDRIESADRSGADGPNKRIQLAPASYGHSDTWLASVLVHETRHIELYASGKPYGGQAEELDCNAIQLRALKLIGAPKTEIDWLEKQDGLHFDLNGDGVYDEADYKLRDW